MCVCVWWDTGIKCKNCGSVKNISTHSNLVISRQTKWYPKIKPNRTFARMTFTRKSSMNNQRAHLNDKLMGFLYSYQCDKPIRWWRERKGVFVWDMMPMVDINQISTLSQWNDFKQNVVIEKFALALYLTQNGRGHVEVFIDEKIWNESYSCVWLLLLVAMVLSAFFFFFLLLSSSYSQCMCVFNAL